MRLVLASASPRRSELLAAAGWTFEVRAVDVDERQRANEPAADYVVRLAIDKARVAARALHDADTGQVVLAADTAVVVDGEVLGKPVDEADAARMLRLLSGRAHEVLTGVAVAAGGHIETAVDVTRVWFDGLSAADIASYVATGEPADKAGAYAIQGRASRFIPRIEGSYTNVVGLPIATVARLLRGADLRLRP
jgi:septum formation protein